MDIGSTPCDMYADISAPNTDASLSKLIDAIEALDAGKMLMAVAQKNAIHCDVTDSCQQMNLELVDKGEDDQQFYFLIRK